MRPMLWLVDILLIVPAILLPPSIEKMQYIDLIGLLYQIKNYYTLVDI